MSSPRSSHLLSILGQDGASSIEQASDKFPLFTNTKGESNACSVLSLSNARDLSPSLFSTPPWRLFCLIIIGFVATPHLEGLSSLCPFWLSHDADYHRLLHFFHSTAWQLEPLIAHWRGLVLSQHVAVEVQGRQILLGDHTAVVKDARRMPGVVTLHQHSETQSKPSYFRGHYWGFVGLLTGSLQEPFCTPLEARLHQGLVQIEPGFPTDDKHETQSARLLHMALDFVKQQGTPAFLILDAFFSSAKVFELANTYWSTQLKQPLLYVLTRAKKSYIAYLIPPPPTSPSPGASKTGP
jgi:hypothetical protein